MIWGFLLGIVTGYIQYMLLRLLIKAIFRVQFLRRLHTFHLIFIYLVKSMLTLVVLVYGIHISTSFMMSSVLGLILIPFVMSIAGNTNPIRTKKEV